MMGWSESADIRDETSAGQEFPCGIYCLSVSKPHGSCEVGARKSTLTGDR